MSAATNIVDQLLALLKMAPDSEYYKQPIASDIDQKLREIFSKLRLLKSADLETVFEIITSENARVLELFAERMASLSVRQNRVDPAKDGLLALLICSRAGDSRDIVMILSLLHDAVIKIGGSAREVFRGVSSVLGGSDLMNEFLERSEEDKAIDSMGYEESKNEEGFIYVRNW